jgi:tetratricopeptide (TPR) repeat protein
VPFESSTVSGADGRFRFGKVPAGTFTLGIRTAARGDLMRTVEIGAGTAGAKGRVDVEIRIDEKGLETDGARRPGATVSATVLSIPDRAMRAYEEAQRCLERSDAVCAAGRLQRAVQIAPQFAAAWNQLGTMAYQQRRYSDAEANFRRALEADPEAFEPLVNLGGVLLNLGRPGEAVAYNQQALARRPNSALANSQLGLTWFELGDMGEAEKYLKAAIRLDPAHFSHPQLTLAEIYLRRGDRAAAAAVLKQFVELHPDAPEAAAIRRDYKM